MDAFTLAASLTLDSKGFEKSLKTEESTFKKIGNKIEKAAKNVGKATAAGIAAGVTAITKLTEKIVDSYGQYEQLVGGVETLFKESADKVQKYADEAYKTAGMNANQYMETVTSFAARLLQGLEGDSDRATDVANQAIIDMSDNANKMGTMIDSIQDAYTGFSRGNFTMLDNLKLGYK